MGFNEVYQSLLELFPQIDTRALKAVAIEHMKDVDAAVETVLEEIIPFFIESSTPSSSLNQSTYVQRPSEALSGLVDGNQTEDDPLVNTTGSAGLQNIYNSNGSSCYRHQEGEDKTLKSGENYENMMKMNAAKDCHTKSVVLLDSNAPEILEMTISENPETEEIISGDKFSENSINKSSDVVVDQIANLVQKGKDIAGDLEINFCDKENALESRAQLVEVPDTHESNFNLEENPKSGEVCMMDVVEKIIDEARDNKKTLLTTMESVICLMRQIELKEQAVEQAKSEAVVGANDILDKVEQLKQMLQHAQEANDMHSGEVYGEKSILGTELKELRSHVVSLSDERDKSLAVLDEMRQTLEIRLAAAETAIQSAELEKLEKEKFACKLLAEQELIMEKVVQESKILKQQAEDNAKMQEFLVDRGHIVDMLQGEIAVISQEDVRVLKQKFEEHVPLSKSLFSSQTSFILASSSSKSLNTEKVPEKNDEQASEEKVDVEDRKALVDDGWDFFDEREINA